MKGLGEAPLPLFAAADAREGAVRAEGIESNVALRPLTAGRELAEDYRSTQLSLRGHPVSFLREELDRMGIARCGDLAGIRDGRNVEVAGGREAAPRLGKRRPVRHDRGRNWNRQRHPVARPVQDLSPADHVEFDDHHARSLQKEGEVIHLICDRILNQDDMLRSVGRTDFLVAPSRADGVSHGGEPDPRGPAFPRCRPLASPPRGTATEQDEIVPIRSH